MSKRGINNVVIVCFFAFAGLFWHFYRLRYGGGETGGITLRNIFVFLVLAPVAEELFFRGFIQNWLGKRLGQAVSGVSYANLTTSVLFSAVHLFSWSAAHSLLVFIPSLSLGFVYERTDRLIYVIFLHSLYNLNFFIL